MAEEDKNISPRILALVCLDMPITEQNVENTLTSKGFNESKKKLHPLVRRALRIALNYGAMHLDDGNYNLHFICHTQLKVVYQPKQEPSKMNVCPPSESPPPPPAPPSPTPPCTPIKTKSIENRKSSTKLDVKQMSRRRKKRYKKKKTRKLKKPICSSLCISSNNTNSSNHRRIKDHSYYQNQRQRNNDDSTETPSYCSTIKKPIRKKKEIK